MFIWYNENPRGNYFAGDCVIRAISIVTGDSWDDIYDELCDKGKYIGDWGNNNGVWDSYLRQRGNRSREPWEPNRRSNANRSMDDRSMDYSRGEEMREEFMERVEMLRNKAPDERTRMKFDKFLNDLR